MRGSGGCGGIVESDRWQVQVLTEASCSDCVWARKRLVGATRGLVAAT